MRRPNYARAAALWLGPCLALACAPGWAARSVRDGVLQDGVPPTGTTPGAGLEQFSIDSEARILDWSSDGALLVAVHEARVEQMRRLSGAPPQGEARSLGAPDATLLSASAPLFSSDWIAYLGEETATGGATGAALNLRAPSGATKTLVPAAARPGAPAWAHDGRRLAFSAALRDAKSTDLYVLDTTGAAGPRLLASGNADARQALAWTSADKSLLVRHTAPVTGDELLVVDVDTGATRQLAPAAGGPAGYVHIGEVRLAPGERGVYFVSDRGGARNGLHYLDLYDNRALEVPGAAGHDIEHFDVSADNRSIALSWTEFGYSRIAILDLQNHGLTELPHIPAGAVTALRFDRAGMRLAFELASSVAPRDVYVCQLADRSCARWTASRLGEYTAARLVAPLTVRFPTWDRPTGSGNALTALLYRPRTPAPHPVLIMLGGGGAAPSAMLDPFVQYCVNELGVAVIAPGLRDGEAGVLDLGALLAWLGAQPDLRRDRVMVQGGGLGGTLALTGLGLYGDRLRAAVDVDGMASSEQVMPIRHPVLLLRGLGAPALDAASAEQLLWRLRSAKISSWFVAPPDRRESLTSEQERTTARRVIAQFVAAQLGG